MTGGGGAPDRGPNREPGTLLVVAGALAAATFLLGMIALVPATSRVAPEPGPPSLEPLVEVAGEWLEAFAAGDTATLARLAPDAAPGEVAEIVTEFRHSLLVEAVRAEAGRARRAGGRGRVDVTVELDLAGLGAWRYTGRLDLVQRSTGEWRVAFSTRVLHPALAPDTSFVRERSWPERAPLLAADGSPLTGEGGAATAVLANHVLGSVGEVDQERAAELGFPYLAGDRVGRSGLQASEERRLAGRPLGAVLLVADGAVPITVHRFGGAEPEPVRTTIDRRLQDAAEAALPAGRPAALVVLQASTGEVRAVVSRPTVGFNRALLGRYPPGSTFKVVTTAAVLASGVTLDEIVPCPASTMIGGRRINNAGGQGHGPVPFRTAFARSCNTTFVELAAGLDAADLVAAAESFGFNRGDPTGLGGPGGSFPEPASLVEQIAGAIGQARVETSPLHLASVAAAVAGGGWRPPSLVAADPLAALDPGESNPSESSPGVLVPLDPAVTTTIGALMIEAVRDGTGSAAFLPGQPVGGKTGTAEFGTATPPRTHAWFIGFRGDLAFAVLVEDAGFGGAVAAPIARDFLTRL